jgi:hypothetical protein
MARDTSLTFSMYGKDVSATDAMRKVGRESDSVGKQFTKMGKAAAAGLAIAGAAAAKFAYDAVKAAAIDEKSQKQLALALTNTTKATKAQVKGSEDFIKKLQLSYGIADDKLRPALASLARGTGNLTEAQDLLGLAMDVSAGTGKDLGAVSMALVKAHNGNLGALKRLGIPLSENIVKSKDFNAATKVLATTFGGAAKTNAETFSGRLAIMQENLKESKEQIGFALMPIMIKFAEYLMTNVVPNVQGFVDGLTGVKNQGGEATTAAFNFGEKVRGVIKYLSEHTGVVKGFGIAIASIFVVGKVASMISAITTIIGAFKLLRETAAITAVIEAFATGGVSAAVGGAAAIATAAALGVTGLGVLGLKLPGNSSDTAVTGVPGGSSGKKKSGGKGSAGEGGAGGVPTRAVGGSVMGRSSYYVGENGPELFTPFGSGRITPNGLGGGSGLNVVVNVGGSVIHEKDLAVTVRDNIAQLMRRRGLNPAILGV